MPFPTAYGLAPKAFSISRDFYSYSPTLWGPEPFLIRDGFDPPYDTRDMGFRVIIRIPEPSTLVLATLAAAMLRCQRRRPRQLS